MNSKTILFLGAVAVVAAAASLFVLNDSESTQQSGSRAGTNPFPELRARVNDVARVTLPVSSLRWLERLMIRIGPGAELTEPTDATLRGDASQTSARIRARYTPS